MKLAVIDSVGNLGGGSRFLESLLPAMVQVRPSLEITLFCSPGWLARENSRGRFEKAGISVSPLRSLYLSTQDVVGIRGSGRLVRKVQHALRETSFLPPWLSGQVHREVEQVCQHFDVVYFPWPFLMELPRVSMPVFATFHDFNYRYFFGTDIFAPEQTAMLERTMPQWLRRATPIVSTNFIADELARHYPEHAAQPRVIHLAPLLPQQSTSVTEVMDIVARLGVKKPYLLYPTHLTVHKNLGPLLHAIHVLAQKGHSISLVLTGGGTKATTGRACPEGVLRGSSDPNVIGLGYVNNVEMDALVRAASVVVSTSLYEAGNGPGLDAWSRGIPVAMSNTDAFMEHIKVQGVHAATFDPRSPFDIADKIESILVDPAGARERAQASQMALASWSWERTARKYVEAFEGTSNTQPVT